MASRTVEVTIRRVVGSGVLALLLTLSLGTLAMVALRAEGYGGLRAGDWAAVRFTVWQALLSAGISVICAVPIARALARRSFPGRSMLVTLLGAPFILPVIVGVLGLIAVFGRSGWINDGLTLLGLPNVSIYGAGGVILAHVFFNLPLATRLILQGWLSVPPGQFRLAASLGADGFALHRLIEWPMLKRSLPGAFLLIFLLCLTSFTVALAVGGGPRATTIELAVYQAFRFDFDIGKAATLGLIQIAICVCVAALAFLVPLPRVQGGSDVGVVPTWSRPSPLDWAWIGLGAAFLLVPLGAIVLSGLPGLWGLPSSIWSALWTSVWVAVLSALLCAAMALGLALMVARSADGVRKLAEGIGVLGLATSPLVIGTGLFLMIFPFARPMDFALVVTLTVNAVMSLPFALRVLAPAVAQVYSDHDRLRQSIGMPQGTWARYVVLPAVRRPLGFAMGLAAALSMGDLGVITLFADPAVETLPLALYRLMGAYRMDDAAGAALILVGFSLLLFWMFDRGGRGRA